MKENYFQNSRSRVKSLDIFSKNWSLDLTLFDTHSEELNIQLFFNGARVTPLTLREKDNYLHRRLCSWHIF